MENKKSVVFVVGECGAGKTKFLSAAKTLCERACLPVLVEEEPEVIVSRGKLMTLYMQEPEVYGTFFQALVQAQFGEKAVNAFSKMVKEPFEACFFERVVCEEAIFSSCLYELGKMSLDQYVALLDLNGQIFFALNALITKQNLKVVLVKMHASLEDRMERISRRSLMEREVLEEKEPILHQNYAVFYQTIASHFNSGIEVLGIDFENCGEDDNKFELQVRSALQLIFPAKVFD